MEEFPPAPEPLPPRTRVDSFSVIREIGRGGVGVVYLARDMRLGRRVALKVLLPDQRTSDRAVGQFLHEARTTAGFAHPNIVTLYAVGEHEGHPYLALEYLEGQNLRERMTDSRPGRGEAIRIGRAIASALTEAHRHGVLHRDLKPENILIPPDGRLRVVDFGLATIRHGPSAEQLISFPDALEQAPDDAGAGEAGGTALYLAPEQWKGSQATEAADIWALGLLLHELLAGHHPYLDEGTSPHSVAFRVCSDEPTLLAESLQRDPDRLGELIARCLDKDAGRRPSAAEVGEALGEALGRLHRPAAGADSPFRGLEPFDERHAGHFFGRDPEIAAFLERLRDRPVAPVVGPSGVGKSSFVRAGVIPRLRESDAWVVLTMRPGRQPLTALADLLMPARVSSNTTRRWPGAIGGADTNAGSPRSANTPAELADELRETPQRLALWLQRRAEAERGRVLLAVDQFEEVFTQVTDEAERRAFVRAVCSAADDPLGPVRVVFTIRDDFLGRLARGGAPPEALAHVTVLRSPGEDGLRAILDGPLTAAGYRFDDPALADEIVRSVRGEPAPLPLLQFALRTLWERRDRKRRLLTREAYQAIGGVEGALAEHADGMLAAMAGAQVELARGILLRLVGSAAAPGGPGGGLTRLTLRRSRVLDGLDAGAAPVLDRLVAGRLVTVRRGDRRGDDDAELEIVHESLLHGWERLRRWIVRSRDELALLAEIGQAAELWRRRGSRREEAWTGAPLGDAVRALERMDAAPPADVRAFIDTGRAVEERRVRRRRSLVAGAIALALVTVLGLIGVNLSLRAKEREARAARLRAEQGRASALREGAHAALLRGAMIEARAKLRDALEVEDSPAARILWWTLSHQPLVWQRDAGVFIEGLAFSPADQTLAMGGADRSVRLLDVWTGAEEVLRGHQDKVWAVAFSPDARQVASGAWSGAIRVWDRTGGDTRVLTGHSAAVRDLAFSPDGTLLASSSYDGTVRLWPLAAGGEATVLTADGESLRGLAFHPDGHELACGGRAGNIRVWPLDRPGDPELLLGHERTVRAVAYSADGGQLASASTDGTVRLWDRAQGGAPRVLAGEAGKLMDLAFHPSEPRIVAAGTSGEILVWELDRDAPPRSIGSHGETVYTLALSADGRWLAAADSTPRVRIWDLEVVPVARQDRGHVGPVYAAAFAPDGSTLASGGMDGSVRLWDVATGDELAVRTDHTDAVHGLSFHPDGGSLASGSWDSTIRVLDTEGLTLRRVLASAFMGIHDMTHGPSGRRLLSGSGDGLVRMWDVREGTRLYSLEGIDRAVFGVAVSPDGRQLAHTAGADIRVCDARTGTRCRTLAGHEGSVRGVSFSPDGRQLASGAHDGTVRLWDLASGEGRVFDDAHGRAYHLRFHPDGRRLGVPYSDEVARIWDLQTGDAIELRGHRGEVNLLRFSADGTLAATVSDDGTVRLWDAATGAPRWSAPLMLDDPPALATHGGWRPMGSGTPPVARGGWRQAVIERTRRAALSPDAAGLCLLTLGGELELWDASGDRLRRSEPAPAAAEVVATDGGCVVSGGDGATLFPFTGENTALAAGSAHVATDADGFLLVAPEVIELRDPVGGLLASYPAAAGAVAALRLGERLLLGFGDGTLEFTGGDGPEDVFADTPASPVVSLVAGPTGTVAAGYANGVTGLWEVEGGARLESVRLHGPVVHLRYADHTLRAASELGDHLVLDLSALEQEYCALMQTVWAQVPVSWAAEGATRRDPPRDHRCGEL
jgi:WD40 repeat protein/tRNA A-37 threonylcarbamoyl transferase component Bud32